MKNQQSVRSSQQSRPSETSATPRQQPRPLGALVSFLAKPLGDSENHPRFRGTPSIRPGAFLMTAGG